MRLALDETIKVKLSPHQTSHALIADFLHETAARSCQSSSTIHQCQSAYGSGAASILVGAVPIAGAPSIWVQHSISHVQDRGIGFDCEGRLGVESYSINFIDMVKYSIKIYSVNFFNIAFGSSLFELNALLQHSYDSCCSKTSKPVVCFKDHGKGLKMINL